MGSSSRCVGSVVVVGGLSCPLACGILVPWPGIKPVSPALEGRFLTAGPPGKNPRSIEIIQTETERVTRFKNWTNISNLWENINRFNTHIIGVLNDKEKGTEIYIYIYIYIIYNSFILLCQVLIAVCGIFVVACGIFSCGMWTPSCRMWELVPCPGIEPGLPALVV